MSISNGNPNGKLYIGSVPWGVDYSKGVLLFGTKAEQQQYFLNNFTLVTDKLTAINPNGEVDIGYNLENVEKMNYLYYVNDTEVSHTYYCCFITNWRISAKNTTIISIKLDVFQQYIFDVKFFPSMIKRTHISKSADDYKKWTQSEPINVNVGYENEIDFFKGSDWTPCYTVETISIPLDTDTGQYRYGGWNANGDNYTPLFSFGIGNTGSIYNRYTALINAYGTLVDHRTDVLHIRVIPQWLYALANKAIFNDSIPNIIENNETVTSLKSTFNIGTSTLANGYTPKNKKLLSSLARLIVVMNYNGFKFFYKPELFKSNNISFTLEAKPIATKCIYLNCSTYSEISDKKIKIPYDLTYNAAYNSNTGIQQSIAERNAFSGYIGAVGGFVGGAAGIAASLATGNVIGGVLSSATAFNAINNLENATITLQQAYMDKTAGTSTTYDNLSFSDENMRLRLIEVNPSVEDCKVIDNFLSVYGYSFGEYGNIKTYINNRSNWNYIQTENVNLTLNAPNDYITELCNIFNGGVTIWHTITDYGDYSKSNN